MDDSFDALSQAVRLFTILRLIAARPTGKRLGRPQLAEQCGCSVKTIQRDLHALQSARVGIEWDSKSRAYVLPDKGNTPLLVHLTVNDTLALALLHGFVQDGTTFPFAEDVQTTLNKLIGGIAPALQRQMRAACAAWSDLGGMARDYSQAPLRNLLVAAVRQRTVEMLYDSRSSGRTERRLANPYRIRRREGRYLEMDAWCHTARIVKTFALDRVLEVHITDDVFDKTDWQPDDEGVVGGLRSGERYALVVRFDATVASYARERRWPFAAQWENLPDGGVILRGQVQGLEGIVRELLSWRRCAEVLGGPELRQRIAEEAQAIAALYSKE